LHASHPKLSFGTGIVLTELIGIVFTTLLLEWVFDQESVAAFRITHTPASTSTAATIRTTPADGLGKQNVIHKDRRAAVPPLVQQSYWYWSIGTQLTTLFFAFAFTGVLETFVRLPSVSSATVPRAESGDSTGWIALWLVSRIVLDLILLTILSDFCLYWGHRALHANSFLWNRVHSIHHRMRAPTARYAIYIHPVDTAMQVAIPVAVSIIVIQPTLFTFYVFSVIHLIDTTLHHSGLNFDMSALMARPKEVHQNRLIWIFITVISLLNFSWLPGRVGNAFHDQHHFYSNHEGKVANLAEFFIWWDLAFGTAHPASTTCLTTPRTT